MYESPIKIFQQQLETQMENDIFKAVARYGIDVDKEELLKALKYDREQYYKGYDEGYRKGIEDFIDRIREPIISLENGEVCPDGNGCPELVPCVDCKARKAKRIILAAREALIGEEE